MDFIARLVEKEFHKHPFFAIGSILLITFGGGFTFNSIFVRAEDYSAFQHDYKSFQSETQRELNGVKGKLDKVDESLCELKYTSEKNALEQKVSNAESEVFQLSRREKTREATRDDL